MVFDQPDLWSIKNASSAQQAVLARWWHSEAAGRLLGSKSVINALSSSNFTYQPNSFGSGWGFVEQVDVLGSKSDCDLWKLTQWRIIACFQYYY